MSDVRCLRSEGKDRCRRSDVRCPMSDVREGGESVTEQIKSAKDLRVYKRAYALSMEIFELSRAWPAEERYSLTDQIRRASRSVCANIREAWAKRRYEAHFISKLTDADGENGETDTWLDYALDCKYLTAEDHSRLTEENRAVGSMLGAMLNNPQPFLSKH
jgi:four helix bundle protein